jgi:hypothetical protein
MPLSPPQHSATAKPRYVAKDDPAWDERFIAEVAQLKEGEVHPLGSYFAGLTRFDLDASGKLGDLVVTPREYLTADKTPVVYTLRRLRLRELAHVQDLPERQGQYTAYRMGLGKIEGCEAIESNEFTSMLSEATVDRHMEILGAAKIYEVGQAVLAASSAPTPAEGKR